MPNSIKYLLFTLLGVVLTLGIATIPYLKGNIFGNHPLKTYEQDFEKMAHAGDIESVKVITNKNIVEITLSEEAFKKQQYKDLFDSKQNGKAHYFLNITSPETFKEDFDKLQSDLSAKNRIKYDIGQEADYNRIIFTWGITLIYIIIGLLLIVPIYILIFKLIKRL